MTCSGCSNASKIQSIEQDTIETFGFGKHIEEASYLLVADVARGDGQDSSVFHVIRVDNMSIVAVSR